jgi:hypothetical protein
VGDLRCFADTVTPDSPLADTLSLIGPIFTELLPWLCPLTCWRTGLKPRLAGAQLSDSHEGCDAREESDQDSLPQLGDSVQRNQGLRCNSSLRNIECPRAAAMGHAVENSNTYAILGTHYRTLRSPRPHAIPSQFGAVIFLSSCRASQLREITFSALVFAGL